MLIPDDPLVAAGRAHDHDDDVLVPRDGADATGNPSVVMARGAFATIAGLTHGARYRTEDVSDPLFDAIRDNPYRGDRKSEDASQDRVNPGEFSRAGVTNLADAQDLRGTNFSALCLKNR
jgi:hypothetical protein